MSLTLFAKIKFLRKFPDLQYPDERQHLLYIYSLPWIFLDLQGLSWAPAVGRSDFSLRGKLGRSDSQIGRSYSANYYIFCQFKSKLAIRPIKKYNCNYSPADNWHNISEPGFVVYRKCFD